MGEREWITVEEFAAAMEGVWVPATIRKLAARKDIPAVKVGKRWLIHRDAIEHLRQQRGGQE